jgi:hypothetical protein
MPSSNQLLSKGISLSQAGNQSDARRIFLGVLNAEPANQTAWLWYAETLNGTTERLAALAQALNGHPEMEAVRQAYQKLSAAQASIAQPQTAKTEPRPESAIARRPLAAPQAAASQPVSAAPRQVSGSAPRTSAQPARPALGLWIISAGVIAIVIACAIYVNSFAVSNLQIETEKNQQLLSENSALQSTAEATNRNLQSQTSKSQQLLKENTDLQSVAAITARDLQTRTQQNQQLLKDKTDLQTRLDKTALDLKSQTQKNQELLKNNTDLQTKVDNTTRDFQSQTKKNEKLQTDYKALEDRYNKLHDTAQMPPYILIHERSVSLAFYSLNKTILYWEIPFDDFERSLERGHASRTNPLRALDNLTLVNQDKKEFLVEDFRKYVEPGPFTDMLTQLYQQSEDDDQFIREAWNIVGQLTNYVSEKIETPRYPLETLLSGGGDCEDTSILFASMIKAARPDWQVRLIYLNADTPSVSSKPNHVMVAVKTPDQDYIIETTSKMTMQPFSNVYGWWLEIP